MQLYEFSIGTDMAISKKCKSCGDVLGPFERDMCGPCRIKDPKFKEESDDNI